LSNPSPSEATAMQTSPRTQLRTATLVSLATVAARLAVLDLANSGSASRRNGLVSKLELGIWLVVSEEGGECSDRLLGVASDLEQAALGADAWLVEGGTAALLEAGRALRAWTERLHEG
jgi:hypothetical protein